MKTIKINNRFFGCCFVCILLITGCDLHEVPQDTTSNEAVFGSERGLELYTNSFYEYLPGANAITRGDEMSDYASTNHLFDFLIPGNFSATTHDYGWEWGELRNINYFLVNNTNPEISSSVRNHYNGVARFFRAWFYFDKVKRFGDVPWIDQPLDIDDPELEAERDPREFVMERVLEDLDYAIENINTVSDPTKTEITVDAALALKSRIALFEGTFRKYHLEFELNDTANDWLVEAVDAAEEIINNETYSLYEGAGENLSYRELFITDSPNSTEDILSVVSDSDLGVQHSANWWYTSGTFGIRLNLTRQFIHTYLNIDGAPFTEESDYATMVFTEETEGRDKRLQQTIRTPGYTRIDAGSVVSAPPTFTYTQTGYQPIKWVVDDVAVDGGNNNTNSVSIFRYAEILLNYAEAKAELGTITNEDWAETVGALRSRAGITGGLFTLPTTIDTYFQSTYFPDISDPVILEIRRERSIELVLEGFRFDDIRRWKRGELLEMEWRGLYVPEANEYMDLSGDGSPNVYFYTTAFPPSNREPDVQYINVNQSDLILSEDESGELIWLPDIQREWENRKYLYPVPEVHIQRNSNLSQNPGW